MMAMISQVKTICLKMMSIQKEYVAIEGLFTLKELRQLSDDRDKFRLIQQIWQELIRSITMNRSLLELGSHDSVIVHLNKAAELLEEIRDSLTTSQARLCGEHPRLYFID
jgi:hypothetical protein